MKRSAGRRVRVERLVGNATGRKLMAGRWPELEVASEGGEGMRIGKSCFESVVC